MEVFPAHLDRTFVKIIKIITVFWFPILGPILGPIVGPILGPIVGFMEGHSAAQWNPLRWSSRQSFEEAIQDLQQQGRLNRAYTIRLARCRYS